ncbi:MAG TPA: VOC family protein [Candidatus Acidoferrales bacterium]|nr:VOC family protein [Candidatus Acidoferrales bacterium]
MSTPIIKVSDMAFPRFRVPDLDRMEAFLTAFGMQRSARSDDALYMRGTDRQHHVHVSHRGEPAFLGLAFRAASRNDLQTLARVTGAKVEPTGEPGGGEIVHLTDPDGRRIDVLHGVAELAPLPLRGHPALNTGADRPRIGTLQRVAAGPAQVKRCGHAAIKSTNLATLSSWYRDTLGMLVSDDIFMEGPDKPMGRFLRCDRGSQPADHHTLLLLETPEVKLGHVAFEVADFDDLMVGHDHLQANGQGGRPYWGIGRHILGGQIFDYWKDPYGFTIEHWTDSDLLQADTPAGSHHILNALNQWGPMPPPDLDF